MTLQQEEIGKLSEAYKKYGTLREVSRKLARSPNTVKKYVSLKMKIKTQNIVRKVYCENDLLIGTYVGICWGDGTQYFDHSCTIKICSNKNDVL